jgi:hypothetical protein
MGDEDHPEAALLVERAEAGRVDPCDLYPAPRRWRGWSAGAGCRRDPRLCRDVAEHAQLQMGLTRIAGCALRAPVGHTQAMHRI